MNICSILQFQSMSDGSKYYCLCFENIEKKTPGVLLFTFFFFSRKYWREIETNMSPSQFTSEFELHCHRCMITFHIYTILIYNFILEVLVNSKFYFITWSNFVIIFDDCIFSCFTETINQHQRVQMQFLEGSDALKR